MTIDQLRTENERLRKALEDEVRAGADLVGENARLREALDSLCRVGLDCLRDGSRENRHRLIDAIDCGEGVLDETAPRAR